MLGLWLTRLLDLVFTAIRYLRLMRLVKAKPASGLAMYELLISHSVPTLITGNHSRTHVKFLSQGLLRDMLTYS